MVGHGGSSAGSHLADPTSPIPSHCASIVATSTLRVNTLPSQLRVEHFTDYPYVDVAENLEYSTASYTWTRDQLVTGHLTLLDAARGPVGKYAISEKGVRLSHEAGTAEDSFIDLGKIRYIIQKEIKN